MNNVAFKFCRPSGAPTWQPSRAMIEALQQLSRSDELKLIAANAQARGRKLVVQVFHSSHGVPILIHLATVPEDVP